MQTAGGARTGDAFGALLKTYRVAAGLTQEALAEYAGLGRRSIQTLEGGRHLPHEDTAHRLARALGLGERERALLLAAAMPAPRQRGSVPAVFAPVPPDAGQPAVHWHTLPAALSNFVGRERERSLIRELLARARLVTLTGIGGVGKTRLALAVAAEVAEAYRDGVWFVELAPLADAAPVPGALAQVLAVQEESRRPLLETLTDYLRERHLLLVLDNCEHLLHACSSLVAALLRAAPGLVVLATSREPLRVPGEQRYRVPSLAVPDRLAPGQQVPIAELAAYEAVTLFVERVRELRPDFVVRSQDARTIAHICTRLDGIPLALELAAARVDSLGLSEIAARLDDRFRLLTGGPRTALPRQRTLRAALDWSYDLLTEPEQRLFDRLAIFAGGWSLPAAEAVCAGDGLGAWEVLDLLDGLVAKSLVQLDQSGDEARYWLHETVRLYCRERRGDNQEYSIARELHLRWCLQVAEESAPGLLGPERLRYAARLETEHDNVRAALHWAFGGHGDAVTATQLTLALAPFWEKHGHLTEGRVWLTQAMEVPALVDALRARVLSSLGHFTFLQGDPEQAKRLYHAALGLREAFADRAARGTALRGLGNVAMQQGDVRQARACLEESLAVLREAGDQRGMAHTLNSLGIVAASSDDLETAVDYFTESLALYRALGDRGAVAGQLGNLAVATYSCGDYRRATEATEEALALAREVRDTRAIAIALHNLGDYAERLGEYERAGALYREALIQSQEQGLSDLSAEGLEGVALVVAARGECVRAAQFFGAAERWRETLGVPVAPIDREVYGAAAARMRAALSEDAYNAALAAGRLLSHEEAVALALATE